MSDQNSNDTISFDLPKNQSSVIKVIGVGGGGSNAVNHMFNQGIRGVDFVICNTDAQALNSSPVPNKIQLGVTLTEGLGAGANPEVGQQSAQESINDIKSLLETNTKMVFITAGMGGGTGTGAAPVIAKAAKEAGILTVGIVTIPFAFEGANRKTQAEKGVEALRNNVDSLVVINNNKLREVYGNLGFKAGFAKADEVLATASRGIAEVITHHYTTNIDLRDARTVLADSGTAIMGSGSASGENRAKNAIKKALDSPLLNDNHIKGAKNVLLLIVSGNEEITIDEIGEINDHIQAEAGGGANIIMGIGEDEDLGEDVNVTIVATGFNADQQVQVIGREPQKVVHTLEDEQAVSTSVYSKPIVLEEEEEDNSIAQELERAIQNDAQVEQAALFNIDNKATENSELIEQDNTNEEEEEEVNFSIDTENVTAKEVESAIEEEEKVQEPITTFTLDMDEEETVEQVDTVFEIKEDTQEEKVEEIRLKNEEIQNEVTTHPAAEKEEVKRFSLEDLENLEEQLNSAKPEQPTAIKDESPQPEEDNELKFEIKKVEALKSEEPETKKAPQSISPVESTIEESMRLRGEERRTKLKAFNYRFKNNPNSVDEAESVPAFKRQGLKIEDENYSKDGKISRFTIDDGESGTDIKTNNSFLHDNVD